jgi:hypothetical protein
MPTYNGWSIVTMPTTPSASSVEFTSQNVVAVSTNPFTGQQQTMDWGASWLEASLTFPPMTETQATNWITFLMNCRGQANVFQLPTFLAAFIPSGAVPGGYWRMKSNRLKWSVSQAVLFGLQFEIREAI